MATYNGEAYLKDQLESLLRQTFAHWKLTIHDDGSSDNTLAIIRDYQQRDNRIHLLDDGVSGLGSAKNYLHLMQHVDGEYYMFCDQDDIWLENKVARMVDAISRYSKPAAVYTNAYLYKDADITPQKSTTIHPSTVRNTLFFNSGIQGCAVIINHQLLEMLRPFPDHVAMHDHLITMGAVSLGTMTYLDEVHMLYRQHRLNVTGNQLNGYLRKAKSFLCDGKPVIDRAHYEANESFYQRYYDLLDESTKELFRAYFRYANSRSVSERLFILLKNRFVLGDKKGILLFKTVLRKPIN
ncbi:glycosyltransferase family 2 protein [Parapedobacter tibetensis]|nr:glycosyltransferase family 2 protein [Parapedobacter tibetensis]